MVLIDFLKQFLSSGKGILGNFQLHGNLLTRSLNYRSSKAIS